MTLVARTGQNDLPGQHDKMYGVLYITWARGRLNNIYTRRIGRQEEETTQLQEKLPACAFVAQEIVATSKTEDEAVVAPARLRTRPRHALRGEPHGRH